MTIDLSLLKIIHLKNFSNFELLYNGLLDINYMLDDCSYLLTDLKVGCFVIYFLVLHLVGAAGGHQEPWQHLLPERSHPVLQVSPRAAQSHHRLQTQT